MDSIVCFSVLHQSVSSCYIDFINLRITNIHGTFSYRLFCWSLLFCLLNFCFKLFSNKISFKSVFLCTYQCGSFLRLFSVMIVGSWKRNSKGFFEKIDREKEVRLLTFLKILHIISLQVVIRCIIV